MSWQTKSLGDVCEFQRGLTYAKADEVVESGSVVLRACNVDLATNLLDMTDLRFIRSSINIPEVKKVRKDSLLVCTASGSKSHLGKVAMIDDAYDYAFGGFMGQLTPKSELVPKYLFHLMTSTVYKDFIGRLSDGANINNLKFDDLARFQVPFPSQDEQCRIVAILDQAFAGIATAKANANRNLQDARAVFDNHLQEIFARRHTGWAIEPVGNIARHSLGKMLDKAKNKGTRQPYLRNINVRWFQFDLSDLLQMPFEEGEAEKYTAVKGDVLICEGGYPGRAAIWQEAYPTFFQKALHRVRFQEPEHSKWFVYFLYSQDKNGELKRSFSGTGIQHFTGEALARFNVPLPPLAELRSAVAQFEGLAEETKRLESIYTRKLAALDELKQSLLQQAFSGEL